MKPQVGEAETNVGVSQSDAGHIFDDVDNGDTGDVISENTNGKSATKTGFNFFQENSLWKRCILIFPWKWWISIESF